MVLYHIVSRYFVWYRIVSIVFSYGGIVPSLFTPIILHNRHIIILRCHFIITLYSSANDLSQHTESKYSYFCTFLLANHVYNLMVIITNKQMRSYKLLKLWTVLFVSGHQLFLQRLLPIRWHQPHINHIKDGLIDWGLTSHQTHYRSYQGQVFTGQMTQINSVEALKEDRS